MEFKVPSWGDKKPQPGRPPITDDGARKKRFTISFTQEKINQVDRVAREKGTTRNAVIQDAVYEYLKAYAK